MITGTNTNSRTDLKLPLSRHDFTIGTTNTQTGVKTSFIVSIDNVTTKGFVCTNCTIVRTLFFQTKSDIQYQKLVLNLRVKCMSFDIEYTHKCTWGPGKPPRGQPNGHFTSFLSNVYSCSIPNLIYNTSNYQTES